ncbi:MULTISPECIES: PD-(D/E)XK nuclease family protein [Xanthomonas]|uniref:PD-(D/E)XK endonuclease-like domain-containing protein n=4 Tax=Xanthomonas TaxID=338 RepID=A0A6V7FGR3_9XANT|nr:hypothetical protein BJD13_00785 [Xanthomonas perforans]APP78112.1 hypothetical protein BJD12_22515 [Xanthomonas vesicatoria ATCC 35937]APP82579.1 hypothetical protein BJD10_23110 [Xanthomonas hortorum pv. gardneri]APR13217.1 hypothetical protein BI314_23525 [Xanthomonas citri pv. citri]MDG4481330.1 PD-(D/E)XK nuclease family protein [Xanthomonas vesicatoria]NMI31488.1 hypothetical protein [Xanthomonas hortorum pv. vitians]
MSLLQLGMVVGGGLLVIAIYLVHRQPVESGRAGDLDYGDQERQFQPAEIANGTLVLSERYLRCEVPRRLGARADQVYRTTEGILVPVDTKTGYRRVVRREDMVELSVQATVLRHSSSADRPSGRVATWGYIRKIAPGRNPVYLRTPLLTDRELVDLYDRYWKVNAGATALPTREPDNCRHCPVASRCSQSPAVRPMRAVRDSR